MFIAIIAIMSTQERILTPDRKWKDRQRKIKTQSYTQSDRDRHTHRDKRARAC